jgi:putative drug exporter of the RND superfamily
VLERWTRAVHRYRFLVLVVWLAVLVFGIWTATRLPALLSTSFGVPGTDSARGGKILTRSFGDRTDGGFVVVFRVHHPSRPAVRAEARRRLALAARAVPTGEPGVLRAGGGILYGDVDTTLDLQHAKAYTDDLRRALRASAGSPAYVTGLPAIQHDLDPVLSSDVRRGESIALPIALLVLVAVFGVSLAVAIPFLFAACTITATLAVVYGLAHVFSMVTYVTNLVELVGLGLAIDYSLLMVHRFREELARGLPTEDAIVRTMATAGRAVVFSGVAVAVGLGLLLFMPVPFIRSMGFGGLLIPLVSIAAALTLQPALLSLFGRRGMSQAQVARFARIGLRTDVERGFWARLARAIMRRPKVFLLAGVALLLAAAAPAGFLRLTPGSISGVPGSLPSVRGFELLRGGVGSGAVTPTQVVVDGGGSGRAGNVPTRAAVNRLADELFHDPEVLLVASGFRAPYVDGTGRYARVIVAGRHEYGDRPTQRFVTRLRHRLIRGAHFPAGVRVYTAGAPAQGADFLDHSYGAFPWLVLAVLVLTYLILLRAFRSLVLPLKAVVLNMLSVAAVYGLLVIVFRWGVGAGLLGVYHSGQVEGWIPIFLFAMLFGLSMDYEVFLVMRMRESWLHVHDNARAVADGLERTGRIITAAAAIMVAAFSGFVAGRVAGLQQFGLGLALAVLVDATIVRAILVPSFMAVLGRYNWWLPGLTKRAR